MEWLLRWCSISIFVFISMGCGDEEAGNNGNGGTDPDTGGTDTNGNGSQTTSTDTDGNEGNDTGSVAAQSLVGRWQYDDEILEFRADGTWVMPGEGEGTWTLEGNLLGLSETESGVEGESMSEPVSVWDAGVEDDDPEEPEMVAYEETETWYLTVAIVDDNLYMEELLIREQGSGDTLDGVWVWEEGEREVGFEGDLDFDCLEMETLSITVTGSAAELEEKEHGTCREGDEEEQWSESERVKGTVETEGQVVYIMGTESFWGDEPVAIPPSPDLWDGGVDEGMYEEEEEEEEEIIFYGYRLTPDIIILDAESAEEAGQMALTRVE